MARWCSITFLGTPGMSNGCHANTSTFARRKAMSALSYLGSRVADGESTTNVVLLGGHLLGRWRSCHCLLTLVGGARWCVLDGSAALRRGALAGVGIRTLAGLGLPLPPGASAASGL